MEVVVEELADGVGIHELGIAHPGRPIRWLHLPGHFLEKLSIGGLLPGISVQGEEGSGSIGLIETQGEHELLEIWSLVFGVAIGRYRGALFRLDIVGTMKHKRGGVSAKQSPARDFGCLEDFGGDSGKEVVETKGEEAIEGLGEAGVGEGFFRTVFTDNHVSIEVLEPFMHPVEGASSLEDVEAHQEQTVGVGNDGLGMLGKDVFDHGEDAQFIEGLSNQGQMMKTNTLEGHTAQIHLKPRGCWTNHAYPSADDRWRKSSPFKPDPLERGLQGAKW